MAPAAQPNQDCRWPISPGQLEAARKAAAKHCRYAAEAVAPIYGRQAKRFAAAIAALQDLLGSHQDTVVAEAWLRDAGTSVPAACVTAGELIAGERLERSNLRSKWPRAWKRASASTLRRWF
jgi:CHAD domain-containing protein